jgi:hypothetical protein
MGRRYPGGEMVVESAWASRAHAPDEDAAMQGPQAEFDGGLEAALAAWVLSQDDAAWLRELTRLCGLPPTPVTATEERRAALERLIAGLVMQAATEQTGMADMRVHLALDTAAALGLLDEEDRRRHEERLEHVYAERAAEGDTDAYDDDVESELLIGFKGIAAGPEERNGRRLIAVECFDEGLMVRWEAKYELPAELHGRPEGEVYERFRPPDDSFDLVVLDDVGAHYRQGGGGGSAEVIGDCWVSSWVCRVRPGLSPGATVLSVAVGGESFEVDISGITERPTV